MSDFARHFWRIIDAEGVWGNCVTDPLTSNQPECNHVTFTLKKWRTFDQVYILPMYDKSITYKNDDNISRYHCWTKTCVRKWMVLLIFHLLSKSGTCSSWKLIEHMLHTCMCVKHYIFHIMNYSNNCVYILVEVSTTWWVSLLLDQGVPEGTCSQVLYGRLRLIRSVFRASNFPFLNWLKL